jgi:hypothetical protein
MPGPDDIMRALGELAKKRLLVGIPAENNTRPGEPIGNAVLGYIHNFGSPARNIPARPHLVPGVEAVMPAIQQRLEMAARAALAGDEAAVDRHLGEAGIVAVNSVQATIQAGIPPPLQPRTVTSRRRRSKGSRYRRRATQPSDVTPLIDTGALLRSYTWVIRKVR